MDSLFLLQSKGSVKRGHLSYSIREMDWAEMKNPSFVISPVSTTSASPSTATINVPSSMGRSPEKR